MNMGELHERIATITAKELAAEMRDEVASMRLLTVRQTAEMLGVSEPTARRLIKEYVELGEATKRVSLATIRQIIADRTIKTP